MLSCLLEHRGLVFGKEPVLTGSEYAASTEVFNENRGTRTHKELLGNSCLRN